MNVVLAIAGLGCFVLAFGHTTIGLRWVLPNLTKGSMPSTPLGPPAMTLGMVRFTWQIVSVVLVAFGVLFMTLAWAPDADPKTLLLRWCAALWLAATALAGWNARRRPRSLLRSPVPLVFVVIAALCWTAST
jgi:4-amino-4-deoxy-L-arabinose transferase-like glycosyltransferase